MRCNQNIFETLYIKYFKLICYKISSNNLITKYLKYNIRLHFRSKSAYSYSCGFKWYL